MTHRGERLEQARLAKALGAWLDPAWLLDGIRFGRRLGDGRHK
jgi:hypothetical protein